MESFHLEPEKSGFDDVMQQMDFGRLYSLFRYQDRLEYHRDGQGARFRVDLSHHMS